MEEQLFKGLSPNQRRILEVLLQNPQGLLSSELASKTHISNKSGTITPKLRRILEENGFELVIERSGRTGSLWRLSQIRNRPAFVTLHMGDECILKVTKTQARRMYDELLEVFGDDKS